MLNKMKLALAGSLVVASMASNAAYAATATGNAEVDIIAPVTVTAVNTLDFGIIAVGATGGTVLLPTASDTRTCSAVLTCVGTAQRGSFSVTASSGYTVNITVDPSTTLTSGGNSMALSLASSTATIAFTSAAAQTFHVGGTLTVAGAQAAGTYTGTYNVSANYQ